MKKSIILVFAALAALLCLVGCGKKATVAVDEYLMVTLAGADGEGTAAADLNIDALYAAIKGAPLDTTDLDAMLDALQLAGRFTFEFDKAEGLSNGDKVTLTATTDKDTVKEYGLASTTASTTVEVAGLGIHPYDALIDAAYFDDGLIAQLRVEGIEFVENNFYRMPFQPTYDPEHFGGTRYVTDYNDLKLEAVYLAISHVSLGYNPASVYAIYSADVTFEKDGHVGTRYFIASFLHPTFTWEDGAQLDWSDRGHQLQGAFESLDECRRRATTPTLNSPDDWDYTEIDIG